MKEVKIRNPRLHSETLVVNKIRHPKLNLGEVTRIWTMLIPEKGGTEVKKESYSQVVRKGMYKECKKMVDNYRKAKGLN